MVALYGHQLQICLSEASISLEVYVRLVKVKSKSNTYNYEVRIFKVKLNPINSIYNCKEMLCVMLLNLRAMKTLEWIFQFINKKAGGHKMKY